MKADFRDSLGFLLETTRRARRFFVVGGLVCLCAWLLGAREGAEDSLQAALDEMRAVEAQIRLKLRQEAQRKESVVDLDKSIRLAEEFIRGNEKVRIENRRYLEGLQGSVERDLAAIDRAIDLSREDLERSRRGIQLAAPLMLHAARNFGPSDERTLVAALLRAEHGRRAYEAIEQGLRLEEVRASRLSKRERVGAEVDLYASLAELPVQDLRRRHRELSNQLKRLHTVAERNRADLELLASRQAALRDLVVGLADGSLDATAIRALRDEAQGPTERPGSDLTEMAALPPPPADLPEIPYDENQTRLELGTRQGVGKPTMTLEIPVEADLRPEDEHRYLVWKTAPIEVRAILGGRVLFGGAFAGYRHLLIVDHGGGWTTLYGNLSDCDLLEGDEVKTAQAMGRYATGPEAEPLWVEARKNGEAAPIADLPGIRTDWESTFLPQD